MTTNDELRNLGRIVRATADNPLAATTLSRRRFLIAGGASITFGSILAACAGGTETGVARIGNDPGKAELVDAPVTDVALLRTATSLEFSAIYVYEAAIAAGLLSGDAATLAARFLDDHMAHADATASLTVDLGGTAWEKPNPRIQSVYVDPALALIVGDESAGIAPSDDPASDVLALAYALETVAAATYQSYVPLLTDPALRAAGMGIGSEEARHAATLGAVLNPDRLVSSMGLAIPAQYKEEGEVAGAFYASPTAFGTLAPVPVVLGKANDSGIRTTVQIETPSLNSMVYEYLDEE